MVVSISGGINRSDFNANGEKAVFFGAMYDMKNWDMPGWAFGASYVYAWDAKPGRMSSPMRTMTLTIA
ncbi:N-acetylglucosamine-regulated outer membrane porin [Klebsiella pneumoniae]|uniref:N-acetylglucosamine-regulated outer membrane porin n=1 Tax=Klebsiella pneumoniae TaxID=573 RepID=A0A377W5P7_KLEPN|nr:N-acetylglucosamine-regulated outer membrane porin [Klebsiella pneumoniae]